MVAKLFICWAHMQYDIYSIFLKQHNVYSILVDTVALARAVN